MRIHIAIVAVGDFPSRAGGFDSFVSEFAPRAAEYCDVSVYCQERQPGPIRLSQIQGVKRVGVYRLPGYRGLLQHRNRCMVHAIDAGATAVYLLGSTIAPVATWHKMRHPSMLLMINPDGMEWWRSGYRWWERVILAGVSLTAAMGADMLVCDSEAIARRYQPARLGRPTVFMPYAVTAVDHDADPGDVLDSGLVPNDYYLMVGRCVRENHIVEVVRWWSHVPTSKKLAIVTDFEHTQLTGHAYAATLRAAVAESQGKVLLIGPVYDIDRLNTLRMRAFAYVHGHSVGGTNPSLLESMACGRPIIAHDNEFNREVLGTAGMYFDGYASLSITVSKLERGSVDPEQLGLAARERVQELYSWQRVMGVFCNEMLPLLERRERS